MNEQEFIEKIKNLNISFWNVEIKCNPYSMDLPQLRTNQDEITLDDYIKKEWITGGVKGGSCWDTGEGDDPHYPCYGEKEPEFDSLDKILTALTPEISFLKYKSIMVDCIENDDRTEMEYYGNYTTYGIQKITLRKLYEKMKALSLI